MGYRAKLCLFPEQQKAFFVAINTDSETAGAAALAAASHQITGKFLGHAPVSIAAWFSCLKMRGVSLPTQSVQLFNLKVYEP